MKQPSLPTVRSVIRDVVIPICGVILFAIQVFLPGERYALVAGALAMMGLPAVAWGARKLDEPKTPPREGGE